MKRCFVLRIYYLSIKISKKLVGWSSFNKLLYMNSLESTPVIRVNTEVFLRKWKPGTKWFQVGNGWGNRYSFCSWNSESRLSPVQVSRISSSDTAASLGINIHKGLKANLTQPDTSNLTPHSFSPSLEVTHQFPRFYAWERCNCRGTARVSLGFPVIQC